MYLKCKLCKLVEDDILTEYKGRLLQDSSGQPNQTKQAVTASELHRLFWTARRIHIFGDLIYTLLN